MTPFRVIVTAAFMTGAVAVGQAQDREGGMGLSWSEVPFLEPEPEPAATTPVSPPPQPVKPTPEWRPYEGSKDEYFEARRAVAGRELERFTSPTLTRFADEKAFSDYVDAAWEAQYWGYFARREAGRIQFAQAQTDATVQSDTGEPICPDGDPACLGADESSQIVTTGSRIAPRNPSITNNQMRNVEEGDIVKQIGNFLLVLQDGRIFVVDTRAGGGRGLALADRIDVYRDATSDMWYDEMLVFGNRILITGYSYDDEATELSVFRLGEDGRLAREGVFYISSDDYYDSSNYATRLIGDSLVVYTPFEVSDLDDPPEDWPVVRRWIAGEARSAARARGRPLFDATDIYRPVRTVADPVVHTVSVCPLGAVGPESELPCRSTAFVGPDTAQWYVTEHDAFLWTTSSDYDSYDPQNCDNRTFEERFEPALLYRVPIDFSAPGVVGARGLPPDQFSLHSVDGRFLVLLKDRRIYCNDEPDQEAGLSYLDLPLAAIGTTLSEVSLDRYAPLPGVGSHYIANRFTDRFLVYGSLGRYRRGLSQESTAPAFAVPAGRPQDVRTLDIGHTVIRAEQAGDDIVLTGYRDSNGLRVTLIDLDRRPRIASSVRLSWRFESEGRSHAFNSLIEENGSGVMGLPTTGRETWSSRSAWRSRASDLSFIEVDRRGQLHPVGELVARADAGEFGEDIEGYECEVSCIDWYGNSRPIFTDGRLFALTGTEMIEGRIDDGTVSEVQRLDIARPQGARLAARD